MTTRSGLVVRAVRVVTVLMLGAPLAGCALAPPPGEWVPIDVERAYLARVELAAEPAGPHSSDVCAEARSDIERQLRRDLPARLGRVELATTEAEANARIDLRVTRCETDVHQWDVGGGEPSFTHYLRVTLEVSVRGGGATRVERSVEAVEQKRGDVPNPIFDFTHRPAVRAVLALFDDGRVRRAPPSP